MISGVKMHFPLEWSILLFKLQLEPFLITVLIQTSSKLFVNFIDSTNNIVHVLLK